MYRPREAMRGFNSTLAMQTSNRRKRRPTGRPRKPFNQTQQYARKINKQSNAQARKARGPSTTIVISTYQNTPEWEWFCGFHKGKGNRNSVSRQAREDLRKILAERNDHNQTILVEGLERSLKARILELEYRDAEILNLRHALGYHGRKFEPNCEACAATTAEVIRE